MFPEFSYKSRKYYLRDSVKFELDKMKTTETLSSFFLNNNNDVFQHVNEKEKPITPDEGLRGKTIIVS